ncbi:MAG: NhaP-type Na+/H+ or K+/H+ antiporter [Oleiphilaceae bacterium]|jgi:NhaP-type Na+/H+ or K+/H+ antiporter
MVELQLISLASIGVISLICQWIAWQLRLPAILFLLLAGVIVGPWLGLLSPDELFGDMLFPIVSLAVAVILFEGSLTLKFSELKEHGKMVRNLLISGSLVTWLIGTLASKFFVDISWVVATLFGAIVVVSGPTVIMPLLRSVKPNGRIRNILKWEGIVIDPIGALLAVLVFEFALSISLGGGEAAEHILITFGSTLVLGTIMGCSSGYYLGLALRNRWLPHFLQNAGTLTFMLGVFAFSNFLVHESGLLTVTIMGIWLANMKGVPVDEILEFKESLSVLLISALFILLAARMEFTMLTMLGWGPLWVILILMFVARPLAVWIAAFKTDLTWQEKTFLGWVAPRGIVAAAVSALFAFKLEIAGYSDANALVSMVFLVIMVTVIVQSITSRSLARILDVREEDNNGFLFIGANAVARGLAKALVAKNIRVILSDTSWENIRASRMENLPVYYGNPVSEHAENHLDLTGIGKMLAISPYKQLNTLSTYHYLDLFSGGNVFGLPEGDQDVRASHQSSEKYVQTRNQFDEKATFAKLASLISKSAGIKTTQLTHAFTFEDYLKKHGNRLTLLFALKPDKELIPLGQADKLLPQEGWDIISLIQPMPELTESEKDKKQASEKT